MSNSVTPPLLDDLHIPYKQSVCMGIISYTDTILKFGKNESVGAGAYEDIWFTGGTEALLTSGETMDIVSSSGDDDSAGTGIQTLTIHGLDDNYSIIKETITMDGVTPVTTTTEFLRVYRAFGETAGTEGANVGTITITASTAASVHGTLEIGRNQTQKTQFTIPASFFGLLLNLHVSALKNDQYVVDIRLREEGAVENTLFSFQGIEVVPDINFTIPFLLPPKSNMRVCAISTGGGGASINAFYQLLFVNENRVRPNTYRF